MMTRKQLKDYQQKLLRTRQAIEMVAAKQTIQGAVAPVEVLQVGAGLEAVRDINIRLEVLEDILQGRIVSKGSQFYEEMYEKVFGHH
jgi:hypothetical protein